MSDYRIGDEVYIHGIIDEIRKDTIIIKNEGGYFGTVADEIMPSVQPDLSEYSDKLWRNAYERGKREAQPERKWIPCSEKLPERGKDVLVTRDYDGREDNNKSCRYVEVASCYGEDDDITWNSFSDEYKMKPRNHHVIAWIPLPSPYQAERREK